MGKGKPRWPKPADEDDVERWLGQYWCGCGDPASAYESLREVMAWWQPRGEEPAPYCLSLENLKKFEAKHDKGVTMMILYFMDGSGITEHGGSVYGSWLTPLGERLKEYLEANPDLGKEDD